MGSATRCGYQSCKQKLPLGLLLLFALCAATTLPLNVGLRPPSAQAACAQAACAVQRYQPAVDGTNGADTAQAVQRGVRSMSEPGAPSIVFKCPDGRLGLHIVHTRFLIQQPRANPIFVASRLLLLKTFMIPSLNAQTNQNFVVYASHDARLSAPTLQAFRDALGLLTAHTLTNGELATSMQLNYSQLAARLAPNDARVADVDLFITSRIDIDDATHVGSVQAVQDYACRRSRGDGTSPPSVRVAYIQGGQLWFPSASPPGAVYGMAGVWKYLPWENALYRVLAIMQSMVISGQRFMRRCPLDVYGYRHYMPTDLEKVKLNVSGCEFKFSTKKHVLYWFPPDKGDLGNLYVRTASSWTYDKDDLRYKLRAANVTAITRSFGISTSALSVANILFAGLGAEGAHLLEKSSDLPIERR